MRRADMTVGADVYYAPGPDWRYTTPTKATIADDQPYRIVRSRQGPFTFVSYQPDPTGNAILVDLHEANGTRRVAIPARDLRGLWTETLAKLGRTEAQIEARHAAIRAISTGEVTGDDVLRLAATDDRLNDDAFIAIARAVDGRDPND